MVKEDNYRTSAKLWLNSFWRPILLLERFTTELSSSITGTSTGKFDNVHHQFYSKYDVGE